MNLLRCVLMAEMLSTPLILYLLNTFSNMSKGSSASSQEWCRMSDIVIQDSEIGRASCRERVLMSV